MRSTILTIAALGLAGVLGGCSTETTSGNLCVMRSAGAPTRGTGPVLTLGAGDALGRAIYMNDLVLASRGVKGAMPEYLTAKPGVGLPAVANVPESQTLPGE